jgi:two-component system sensor histidine kinase YesM
VGEDEVRTGQDFSSETWETTSHGGRTYLVGTQAIANTDWTLMLLLPRRDIVRMSARPVQQMLLAFLAVIPLMLLFAFFASRSATRRIETLIAEMDRVVDGDFSASLDPRNRDEIGRMTVSFNLMVRELGELVEEKYRLGQEVKHLELKALQAQINPHFLYNTLDLINWMSLRYEAHEIRALVNALSRFYKLSLGGGEETVRVRDEIEHVKSYVQIQNMRYEDAVELVVDVPEELAERSLLKLVVQPLVENAISHGIMHKKEERGTIRISARMDGGALLLCVADDGVGMSPQMIRRVLSGAHRTDGHHGYGVRNIHERLRLKYGEEYGLSFRSAEGKGTTVSIRLPPDPRRGDGG